MGYTEAQLNVLRRLDGILENDGIRHTEEFSEAFKILHEKAGISIRIIATGMGQSDTCIQSWIQGSELPDSKRWHWFTLAIRKIILEIIHGS